MATSKSQRIGIIIIMVVMVFGTLGSFFVVIFANKNQKIDQEVQEKAYAEYNAEQEKYQKKVDEYNKKLEEENKSLSPKYYKEFAALESRAKPFDASKVKSLEVKDIKKGNGDEIKDPSEMRGYYIGWNEKGKIFDSSIDDGSLKTPIEMTSVIQGMSQGVIDMRMGGIREITIPADLAYGDQARGDDIPANSPLKFIVLAVPTSKIEAPEPPEIPKELMQQ